MQGNDKERQYTCFVYSYPNTHSSNENAKRLNITID